MTDIESVPKVESEKTFDISREIEIEKTISENHKELQSIFDALNQDFQKFNLKKVKIAGARVRNNLLNCKKLCDKLRKQIQNEVRALPTKHRIIDTTTKVEEKPIEVKEIEENPNVLQSKISFDIPESFINKTFKDEKPKVKRTRKANKLKVEEIIV